MTPKSRTLSDVVARRGRRMLEIPHDASAERIVSEKIFILIEVSSKRAGWK